MVESYSELLENILLEGMDVTEILHMPGLS